MTITCWKVLSKDFTSAIMYNNARVEYIFTDFAEAPYWLRERGYHLLVFISRESAFEFARAQHTTKDVYECECEEEVLPIPTMCWSFSVDNHRLDTINTRDWPYGTRMFKRVKLVRRVEDD